MSSCMYVYLLLRGTRPLSKHKYLYIFIFVETGHAPLDELGTSIFFYFSRGSSPPLKKQLCLYTCFLRGILSLPGSRYIHILIC